MVKSGLAVKTWWWDSPLLDHICVPPIKINRVTAFYIGSKAKSGTLLPFSSIHLAGAQLNIFQKILTLFIFVSGIEDGACDIKLYHLGNIHILFLYCIVLCFSLFTRVNIYVG